MENVFHVLLSSGCFFEIPRINSGRNIECAIKCFVNNIILGMSLGVQFSVVPNVLL